ncbi:MAG: kinase/pyrophosphorylase [Burkholderiales bacterium]|jgi:regulator of PEP synthase PpsR (kinase-PPPase family)|nr:kinase/pyrophosphorylase [Burkholderiales bacterium]MCA3216486.1 kinase/pyrophosphorylase [Burkholderiales bacterium]
MPDRDGPTERTVFFVSDGTGITAETLGHSVMTQFESLRYRQLRIPFVDSAAKAREAVHKIAEAGRRDGRRPVVFSTLVNPAVNAELKAADALLLDLFESFVEPLEIELGMKSSHSIGRSHNISDSEEYKARIEAINFALAHDDGQSSKGLQQADVILVGVSRSGKTPTSLYLAMQYGLKAANYPLIPEDFDRDVLPSALPAHRAKLFGLSIAPERLAEVRHERRPNSRYASLDNCRHEVAAAERLMRREGIRWLSSTTKSIEEIAATIMQEVRLDRRSY